MYIEMAMPFGARSSSSNMQRVANMVVRILAEEGIRARMYLDDLIVIAHTEKEAWEHYARVVDLFAELGLPQAVNKVQTPATMVKWLGINICSATMCLSIPEGKLEEILQEVERCRRKKSIHRKLYESLLGKLLYILPSVLPPPVFSCHACYKLTERPSRGT